jgi:hypothetical protein
VKPSAIELGNKKTIPGFSLIWFLKSHLEFSTVRLNSAVPHYFGATLIKPSLRMDAKKSSASSGALKTHFSELDRHSNNRGMSIKGKSYPFTLNSLNNSFSGKPTTNPIKKLAHQQNSTEINPNFEDHL